MRKVNVAPRRRGVPSKPRAPWIVRHLAVGLRLTTPLARSEFGARSRREPYPEAADAAVRHRISAAASRACR
jgi:hypothetical protein